MKNTTNLFENQIYAFSFPPTKNILYKLRNTDCSYITNPSNFSHFLRLLLHDQPKFILGLGSYTGVDQDKIRIETICTNQFRNEFEHNTPEQTNLNNFLEPDEYMKLGKAMGNSHCNQICWKIMELINRGDLYSQLTFLHIPKSISLWTSSALIDSSLQPLRPARTILAGD